MNQEWGVAPAAREWMGWPAYVQPGDLLQTASAVIATTRYAWTGQAADETSVDRARVALPRLSLVPDAISSGAAQSRSVSARSRRRVSGQFAI